MFVHWAERVWRCWRRKDGHDLRIWGLLIVVLAAHEGLRGLGEMSREESMDIGLTLGYGRCI